MDAINKISQYLEPPQYTLQYYQEIESVYRDDPIVSTVQKTNDTNLRSFIWFSFETFLQRYTSGATGYNTYYEDLISLKDIYEIIKMLKVICPPIEYQIIHLPDDGIRLVKIQFLRNATTDEYIQYYNESIDLLTYILNLCDSAELA